MPEVTRGVQIPILHRVQIDGYDLYPGDDVGGDGLSADLLPGANIVVGINGVGKTTLLNATFRALSGPVDWKKRRLDRPAGTTSTELGKWRDQEYFSERVPDLARDAVITAEVALGTHRIVLSRRLPRSH